MSQVSIKENFAKYFDIVFCSTKELEQEAFKIRHSVYAEELGWEPTSKDGFETDKYDAFSHSLLLKHKRSGIYAGTVRLIIPPISKPDLKIPFEDNCMESWILDTLDPNSLSRNTFGEVSRLAVPSDFRKRIGEKKQPFIFNHFSENEIRNFPNIAVGLYLSAISLAQICNHKFMFIVVEPRLQKHLERVGLFFLRAGENMEYHGTRALFYLPKENFEDKFKPEMHQLYCHLKSQLVEQIPLYPYNPWSIAKC
jgi:N-acyl amino acid synthase of PEP-CTERM/exosortase system